MFAKTPKDTASDVVFRRLQVQEARRMRQFQAFIEGTDDHSNDQIGQIEEDKKDDGLSNLHSVDGGLLSTKDKVDPGLPDGLFSGAKPRSTDQLLEHLIGKKAANAHRKAQTQQTKGVNDTSNTAAKPLNVPAKRKVEDDDSGDEGGRAAAIKSKKSKKSKARSQPEAVPFEVTDNAELIVDDQAGDNAISEAVPAAEPAQPLQRAAKAKPASFLDELLSKKSKKKKKKAGADTTGND